MKKKERKVKFIGDSSDYNWESNPVYGQTYTDSEIQKMYGKFFGSYVADIATLLEPDKENNHLDFEEVFDEPDKKEPTHFEIDVWIDKGENITSVEMPFEDYEKCVTDLERLLEEKSSMTLENEYGDVVIPYKILKKSVVYFTKLWKEKK